MDLDKLVEDGTRLFCCDGKCASLHDGRPCSAGVHRVRTRAVLAIALAAAAEEDAAMTNGDLLLAAGEMTAGELRTVRAVLNWRASSLRTLAAQLGGKTDG